MEKTDKQPQTLGEWLDWAEEQGYEWANEAWKELENVDPKDDCHCLADALIMSFTWKYSAKGHDYWGKIHSSITHA